jgi:hypothetical protein
MVNLPYPHLIAIAPTTVRPLVRAVGEKVRDIVQEKLKTSDVQLFWYHHRWLLPRKAYALEQIASWCDPSSNSACARLWNRS